MKPDLKAIKERFKKVPGWKMEITKTGVVRNTRTGNIINTVVNSHGYKIISACERECDGKKTMLGLHRALCLAFKKRSDNSLQVNHKDGNKINNDLENLEWVTSKQNTLHAKNVLKIGGISGKGQKKEKIKGAYKTGNTWFSSIKINGKWIYLGVAKNRLDAAKLYNIAALKYHDIPILNNLDALKDLEDK